MKEKHETVFRRRTQRDYSHDFKVSVVREVESGDLSATAAMHKYGIQGSSTVLNWIRKYGSFDRELQVGFSMEKSAEQKLMEMEVKLRQLEKQKQSLEQQLKFQQDKAVMFDIIIDIAENEFNIPIRKKPVPGASNDSKKQQG